MATSPCQPLNLEALVNPTERQRDFLRAIADRDYVLYGGAAGGGKSYILRWWLVLFLAWTYRALGLRNVTVGLFCEDYPGLYDRQISKILFEFPAELGELKQGTVKNFQLRPEFGGGIIALRNLDDPSKYQSAEFAAIAVDELTKSGKDVFDFLRFRLRWPGISRPKFAAATNPGSKGHRWVKKLWKDSIFPPELESVKDQFAFIQAKASDNPHLDGSYYRSLLTLPPHMAKAFAEGDWNLFTGQYFPQFSEERHVISEDECRKRIKPWHTHWLSGDWGYGHPHAIYKHSQDETGHVITYGELWERGVNETDLGRKITAACGGEKFSAFAFSWDAGKLSPRSRPKVPKSMMQMMADALGPGIPKPYPADSSPGTRISRARLTAQLLDSDLWHISSDCPRLIECLPNLICDEDNPEDVLKVDFTENEIGDDPYDGASMGLQHMSMMATVPVTVMAERKVAAFAKSIGKEVEEMDINAAAQLHRRALFQEQRRRGQRRGGLGRVWRPQTGA